MILINHITYKFNANVLENLHIPKHIDVKLISVGYISKLKTRHNINITRNRKTHFMLKKYIYFNNTVGNIKLRKNKQNTPHIIHYKKGD